jgi:hypothetical protein
MQLTRIVKKYRKTGIGKPGNQGAGSGFGWEKPKIGYPDFEFL